MTAATDWENHPPWKGARNAIATCFSSNFWGAFWQCAYSDLEPRRFDATKSMNWHRHRTINKKLGHQRRN